MQAGHVIAERYELQERLGSGAFGVVWRARQLGLDRDVAVKVLKQPSGDMARRFEQECRALARIKHAMIVVGPQSQSAWRDRRTESALVEKVLDTIETEYSVDLARRYGIGYATGGDFLRHLSCEISFSAIATISSAEFADESACAVPVPHIRLHGALDRHSPVEGGTGCGPLNLNPHRRLSVEKITRRWADRNRLTGRPVSQPKVEGGSCRKWRGDIPFVSCELDGGRYVEEIAEVELPGCEESLAPNTFPATRVIMGFFEENSVALKSE